MPSAYVKYQAFPAVIEILYEVSLSWDHQLSELDCVILMKPFQLGILYNSIIPSKLSHKTQCDPNLKMEREKKGQYFQTGRPSVLPVKKQRCCKVDRNRVEETGTQWRHGHHLLLTVERLQGVGCEVQCYYWLGFFISKAANLTLHDASLIIQTLPPTQWRLVCASRKIARCSSSWLISCQQLFCRLYKHHTIPGSWVLVQSSPQTVQNRRNPRNLIIIRTHVW